MKKVFYLKSLLVLCFSLLSAGAFATVPTVTKNPVNKTVCRISDTTYFTTAAIDTPGALAISYGWQASADGGTTWFLLAKDTLQFAHVTTDSLVVYADTNVNGYLVRAVATNTDGADTSASAMLTVLYPTAGTITGGNVCRGGGNTLGSTVLGGIWMSSNNSIATIGSTSGVVLGVAFGYDTIMYAVTNTCGADTAMYVIHVDTLTSFPVLGPNVVCQGHFITLTNANTMFGTGTWSESTGNTTVSSTGSVVGTNYGTDVITYDFTNACGTVSDSKTISVDTVINAGTISGSVTDVCYGSWIHFTASRPGGLWLTSDPTVAVVSGGDVTGMAQGTAVISYLFTNSCGVSAATTTVTVFAKTAMIGGIDSVGIKAKRTLTDSTAGGQWFSSDTSIATIDTFTGVVTGKDTGTTTIIYTVTNLCGTSSSYLTLTVGPPPSPGEIFGDGTNLQFALCAGGATKPLFDTAQFGTGVWSSKYDTVATIDPVTGVVTGVGKGLDTIYYKFTNALGTSTARAAVYVNVPPTIYLTAPTDIKAGNLIFRATPYQDWTRTPSTVDFPDANSDVTVGTWSNSNTAVGYFIGVNDSSDLHYTSFGSYILRGAGTDVITFTVKNSCGTSSKKDTIRYGVVNIVKNTTNKGAELNVYPNPTKDGVVTITLTADVAENVNVTITNALGATVKEMNMNTNTATNIRLDEAAGIYFLSATTASGNKYDAKIVLTK